MQSCHFRSIQKLFKVVLRRERSFASRDGALDWQLSLINLGTSVLSQAFTVVHMTAGANFVHELRLVFEKGHQADLARIFVHLFFRVSANVFIFNTVLSLEHCLWLLFKGAKADYFTSLLWFLNSFDFSDRQYWFVKSIC